MRRFSAEELRQHNGKDAPTIYFAYEGRVYDATQSFLWQQGRHWVLHNAGEDLTDSLAKAPHGADLLQRLPVIGILE